MRMTLFVDASFCPDTGAGGWGSWAARDDWNKGRLQGGPLRTKSPLLSSNAAEIAGIGLALWQHAKQGDLDVVTSISIQCDNTAALGFIKSKIKHARIQRQKGSRAHIKPDQPIRNDPLIKDVLSTVVKLLEGKQVSLKHVKGHSRGTDGRTWVNHSCDAEARKYMLELRREMKKGLVTSG